MEGKSEIGKEKSVRYSAGRGGGKARKSVRGSSNVGLREGECG